MTFHLPEYLEAGEPVRQNRETGRWFITIDTPGFNSLLNNGRGYATRGAALQAVAYYSRNRRGPYPFPSEVRS